MKNFLSRSRLLSALLVVLGNFLYALTVKLFVLDANLMSCGTTGLALVVNHLTRFPVPVFILCFNILMLMLGWWILGRQFAMSTVFSSLFYPLALEVLNRTLGDIHITDSMELIVVFAGLGLGLSLGMVIRGGASTGGMDIPPLVLNRFFRIPVSASLWAFDFCILLSQMLFHPLEDLLYGVLLIIVVSIALNKVMLLGTSKTEVKIISEKATEIRDAILSQVDRGVTVLHGEGGYSHRSTEVILSIVSNHELHKIERLARDIDPQSFVIVNRVSEVWGRGFSFGKHDK
jgi:uncharacterized membrane-anchored protein YitT (DUF2179 family)